MTVGELLLFLSGLPRDAPVLSDDATRSGWTDDSVVKGSNVVVTIDADGVYIRHEPPEED
jgi:hypothetical protein